MAKMDPKSSKSRMLVRTRVPQEPPMPSPDHYIPGVCNIGPPEIRRRMFSGWIGFVCTLALAAALFYWDNARPWRLLLFFPAFSAATGFLQGLYHFCLGFGFKAV